jgi:hypothetical protein
MSHYEIPSNDMMDTPANDASYLQSLEEPTIPTGTRSSYKKQLASSIRFKQTTSERQSLGDSTEE